VAKFTAGGRRYDVRLRLVLQQRTSPNNLDWITVRAGENRLVPLSDVVRMETVATLPVINRYNHARKIELTATPAPGVSQGAAIERCQQIAKDVLPDGFTLVELGNAQAMQETMRSLVFALILGVVIAYMILGVQFNSFVHPLTVLLAMPFAVTGALATLWLTGDTLNMMSMIGLILLMGLVKKNSIILVDYTNKLREDGLGVEEAVLTACPVRLRPILMTSVATVAGAIPAALGLGPGAETRAPMARGIIGGIVLSTLVTLVLVPVFYVLIERLRNSGGRLLTAPAGDEPPPPPAAPVTLVTATAPVRVELPEKVTAVERVVPKVTVPSQPTWPTWALRLGIAGVVYLGLVLAAGRPTTWPNRLIFVLISLGAGQLAVMVVARLMRRGSK
jgi:HAE1 family hydrophobic/amphiphilic exporter-1